MGAHGMAQKDKNKIDLDLSSIEARVYAREILPVKLHEHLTPPELLLEILKKLKMPEAGILRSVAKSFREIDPTLHAIENWKNSSFKEELVELGWRLSLCEKRPFPPGVVLMLCHHCRKSEWEYTGINQWCSIGAFHRSPGLFESETKRSVLMHVIGGSYSQQAGHASPLPVVNEIIQSKAEVAGPMSHDAMGCSPLVLACSSRNWPLASLIAEKIVEGHGRGELGEEAIDPTLGCKITALGAAVCSVAYPHSQHDASEQAERLVCFLLEGYLHSPCDEKGRTVLMLASSRRAAGIVERLLALRADPNQTDHNGLSPVHHAISAVTMTYQLNRVNIPGAANETVRTLLRAKPRLELSPPVVKYATEACQMDNIASLLEASAPVDAADINSGCTALMAAAVRALPKVVACLLTAKADPDVRDLAERTALVHAMSPQLLRGDKLSRVSEDVCEQLLGGKANPNVGKFTYGNALRLAIARQSEPVIRALAEAGVELPNLRFARGCPLRIRDFLREIKKTSQKKRDQSKRSKRLCS